ncbi:MAG: hypothetical protein K0S38_206 [Candidatus Paceibacter sp.]|jgi:hypothetical protein|nr:hypothetical protein [Candidatus Paceibacter sp.]
MNKKRLIPVILGLIVILIALWVVFNQGMTDGKANQDDQQATSTPQSTVQSYKNDKYGFELEYPSDWTVTENPNIPAISFHKKSDPVGTSYGLHSTSTGVTIYPQGLGTEGPLSEAVQTQIQFAGATSTLVDMLLKDGSLWGELITLNHGPKAKGWSEYALIWAGLEVKDLNIVCVMKDGKERPVDQCDMGVEFAGSKFVRSGTVNPAEGMILEQILRSFKFSK